MTRSARDIRRHVAISRFDDRDGPVVFACYVEHDWDDIPNHQLLTGEGLDYLFVDCNPNETRFDLTL